MNLLYFVAESNRIEGILREPADEEIVAHEKFLLSPRPTVATVQTLVSVLQPGARLRDKFGLDVQVGRYLPPPGGPDIKAQLKVLLHDLDKYSPYQAHQAYENLHPFTDGNGRSGRAIWLWMMRDGAPLGFLHHWYYQSLQEAR